jgi:polyamine oxidase
MATEWFAMDWELASTAEETSQLFGTVNFNSTWYQYSEDNLFVLDQRGFVEFLRGEAREFLGEKLDDERLVLSHKVLNINYTDPDAKINIRASGAESQYACFEADHVINTFSLGVLQHDMNTMFIPELPSWKTTAINTMQMGIYTKIFMQFPPDKVFWDKSTEFFLYASDHRGRYPVFQSLDHADFHPGSGILFVTVVGDETLRVDQMDDDAVKSEVMDVLRQMFGPEIPEPTDFYFPRWSTTDWAYGSYSNMPPGMSLKQHQNVRANVDRVWFAGEHTSTNYFGFLHGAYFEGKKVAETLAARLDGDEEGGRDYVFYEEVKGCTEFKDYNEDNGWQYDTLAKPQTDVRGRRMKRSSLR